MNVVKKINNNVAICVDGNGNELIAFGKGIGFPKMPYEIMDLSVIDRTFYNVNPGMLKLINDLPQEIIEFSAKMLNVINAQGYDYNPNAILTMADHIEFALERKKNNIKVNMPLVYEVKQKYPKELKYGKYILKQIYKTFNIKLDADEAVGIALNLVNSQIENQKRDDKNISYEKQVIKEITEIIERELQFNIDKDSFNYTRFATHLQYLIHRLNDNQCIDSDNQAMYDKAETEYKDIAECVDIINEYLNKNFNCVLTDEERLYLILHINRVYAKEGL